LRIVFCGNPEFALPTLNSLLASQHDVIAVVTSPDQPKGRGRKLTPMPVKAFAMKKEIPVYSPERLKDASFLTALRELNSDALVVVAFRILPREMFALPKWGALNVHPSLLPLYRGPAPIQWTLLRGETETGVTIIRLTEEIDGGGMLAQARTTIAPDEDFGALHDRLAEIGADMLVSVLNRLDAGEQIAPLVQDESQVTTARKLKPEDYILDFGQPSSEILRKIRAFSPSPGAIAKAQDSSLKILSADAEPSAGMIPPGQVVFKQLVMYIGTADVPISLKKLKPAGKREMTVEEFLRGRPTLPDRF